MVIAVLIAVFVFYLYFDLSKTENGRLAEQDQRTTHQAAPGVPRESHTDESEELSARLRSLEQRLTLIVEQNSNGNADS